MLDIESQEKLIELEYPKGTVVYCIADGVRGIVQRTDYRLWCIWDDSNACEYVTASEVTKEEPDV